MVIYTLKRSADGTLEGPINKKVHASYAPRRHAVAIARREANKRGFVPGSGKVVQIVTDGDNDLERYILEISSGAVEGAVNHVIAKRFDSGGMRWIKERAEALLQLRCIGINGDWEAFIQFVHDKIKKEAQQQRKGRTTSNLWARLTIPVGQEMVMVDGSNCTCDHQSPRGRSLPSGRRPDRGSDLQQRRPSPAGPGR